MTDRWDRLAALEQVASKAPWETDRADNGHWDVVIPGDHGEAWLATLRGPRRKVDANFIAEMRNALPDLLRERAELRAALGDGLLPVKFSEADPSVVILRQCDTFEWRERVRAALAGDRTPAP